MPNYDYTCEKCGHVTERSFHIEERKQQVICEICGKTAQRAFVTALPVNIFGVDRTTGKEMVFEHIDGFPHRVGSRDELVDIVKRAAEKKRTTIEVPYYDISANG